MSRCRGEAGIGAGKARSITSACWTCFNHLSRSRKQASGLYWCYGLHNPCYREDAVVTPKVLWANKSTAVCMQSDAARIETGVD